MGTIEQDLRRYQQQIDEEDELDAATEEELTDPFAQRDFVDELDAEQLCEYMKTAMFANQRCMTQSQSSLTRNITTSAGSVLKTEIKGTADGNRK